MLLKLLVRTSFGSTNSAIENEMYVCYLCTTSQFWVSPTRGENYKANTIYQLNSVAYKYVN